MKSLLEKLNIKPINPGASTGVDGWLMDKKGKELVSYNPTTGEALATIIQATPESYEKAASAAQTAFLKWRHLPHRKEAKLSVIWGMPSRIQRTAGRPGHSRDGQDPRRGSWRSPGDDRYL